MEWLRNYKIIEFIRHRKIWVGIMYVSMVLSVIALVFNYLTIGTPLKLGIDFQPGTSLDLKLEKVANAEQLKTIVDKYSEIKDPTIQIDKINPKDVLIRTKIKGDDEQIQAKNIESLKLEIGKQFGNKDGFITTLSQDDISATVSGELVSRAIQAIILGSFVILIYIGFRFGSFRFALSGVIALIHDVLFVLGVMAVTRIEISSSFIAVILTIYGFSIMDTVIIYDRIRENRRVFPTMDFFQLCDLSLTQTLTRSINTTMTVLLSLFALIIFGGASLQAFCIAMACGFFAGAYSSIFIAAPLVTLIEPREIGRIKTIREVVGERSTGKEFTWLSIMSENQRNLAMSSASDNLTVASIENREDNETVAGLESSGQSALKRQRRKPPKRR